MFGLDRDEQSRISGGVFFCWTLHLVAFLLWLGVAKLVHALLGPKAVWTFSDRTSWWMPLLPLSQWIYVLPAWWWVRRRGHPMVARGVLLGGALTVAFGAGCYRWLGKMNISPSAVLEAWR